MFKNFDKVFKFTFKNQISTIGYKSFTIILCVILFLTPVVIMLVSSALNDDEDEELKSCNAKKMYVINEKAPDSDYNLLNQTGIVNYENIEYINSKNVEDACKAIKDSNEKESLVLLITEENDQIQAEIIVPKNSDIENDDAENYYKFMSEVNSFFTVISTGINMEAMSELNALTEHDVYNSKGYEKGTGIFEDKQAESERTNNVIVPIFKKIIVYLTVMILFFVITMYGSSIAQTIVAEKSSKLMDTMLISVKPEALILGKYVAIVSSGFLQLILWIASATLGIFAGINLSKLLFDNNVSEVVNFFTGFPEHNLFTPISVVFGVLIMILGIMFFTALNAIAGAISSSKEEVAGNQSIFSILLLVGFYIAMFGGALSDKDISDWMNLLPITSALLMPAEVCLGTVSTPITLISILILVACTLGVIIICGRIYNNLALYKGKKLNIVDAMKIAFKK